MPSASVATATTGTTTGPALPLSPTPSSPPRLVLLLLSAALALRPASAILPTGVIDVTSPATGEEYSLLASQASFGYYPPPRSHWSDLAGGGNAGGGNGDGRHPLLELALPPADDPLLCGPPSPQEEGAGVAGYLQAAYGRLSGQGSAPVPGPNPNAALLVPRGSCSFERKALAAQALGAAAVFVEGTLASRYSLNVTLPGIDANSTSDERRDARRRWEADGHPALGDVLWPSEGVDYDCGRAEAMVPTSLLSFDADRLPYDAARNDPRLSGGAGDGNLCALHATGGGGGGNFAKSCPGQRCLLTGETAPRTDGAGGTAMRACCAWDLHVWLYGDATLHPAVGGGGGGGGAEEAGKGAAEVAVTIPAFYVTMEEGARLRATMEGAGAAAGGGMEGGAVGVVLAARWAPRYNPSALLIWALGVAVCVLASYLSAGEYRAYRRFLLARNGNGNGFAASRAVPTGDGEGEGEGGGCCSDGGLGGGGAASDMAIPPASSGGDGASRLRKRSASPDARIRALDAAPSPAGPGAGAGAGAQQGHYAPPHVAEEEGEEEGEGGTSAAVAAGGGGGGYGSADESLELTPQHALGFIVMASLSLTVLFVFKVYVIVKVMYAFGCSGAMTQVMFMPLWERIDRFLGGGRPGGRKTLLGRTAFHAGENFGEVLYLELAACLCGYGLGLIWGLTAVFAIHPQGLTFFWIVQDIMGACMCVMFLSTIKINAVRVASILLVVAFFYDIFFVFVTPLLTRGGESIMITVATSGGPPKADPSWCEKYPRDADCQGGDPLPMLFTVPRIWDYQGGDSLLGLGDIVLPGLLLSLAARFDEAKKLCRTVRRSVAEASTYPSRSRCCGVGGGSYLFPVSVAYAIGLLMANAAVYLMNMGQPALLYLVPCCLGTMAYLGWRRGELRDLWDGPRAIRIADAIAFGEPYPEEDEEGEVEAGTALIDRGGGQ